MRATEFTNRQQPILEGKHQVQLGDLVLHVYEDGQDVDVRVMDGDRQVGYVIFLRDGKLLIPDDLSVDEEYRGRGIAKKMYDYVKSLGFKIIRSGVQTNMGKRFWDKNRGEHVDVWEEEITEEYLEEIDRRGFLRGLGATAAAAATPAMAQDVPDWQKKANIALQKGPAQKWPGYDEDDGKWPAAKNATAGSLIAYRGDTRTGKLETLPTLIRKETVAQFLNTYKVCRDNKLLPSISPETWAALLLVEGRSDFGYNGPDILKKYSVTPAKQSNLTNVSYTANQNNVSDKFGPKMDVNINMTPIRQGLKKLGISENDWRADFCELLSLKIDTAKRLGIPFYQAWNGGTQFLNRYRLQMQAIKDPKNKPLMDFIRGILGGGQGVAEAWSEKYKRSINCKNPKGFSQRAHCQGRKKNNEQVELDERKRKRKKKADRYFYGPAYVYGTTDAAVGGDAGGLEEDWKKSLTNIGLAGAIGLGAAGGLELKDKIKSAFTKPTAQTTQTAQPTKKPQPQLVQVSPITNNPLEMKLLDAAKKSGLHGLELAQFLGQCAHETLDYKRMIERGNKKYFNKYEPRFAPKKARILGNVKPGDGERYKGRGYIQLTGRYNYKAAGEALNLPLEQNPDLAAQPDIAAKIALWYWGQRVKPEVQNFADTTSVTRKINPGLSGLEDRHENFLSYIAQR